MRLIDADAYQYSGDLVNEPTINAVEVVRCKDCKHSHSSYGKWFCHQKTYRHMSPEDFCSYGERKDGADNE